MNPSMMTEWLILAILSSVVGRTVANQFVVSFCRIKRNAETFFKILILYFRFSVPSLNLQTDINLETEPKLGEENQPVT